MSIKDLLSETRLSISANKARSALTILGIVVGIASVIVMIAIGQGAQKSIETSIQAAGSDLVMVMPGFGGGGGGGFMIRSSRGSGTSLKSEDAEAILKEVAGVKAVVQELSGRYQVVAGGNNTNTQVIGTTAQYPSVKNLQMAEGSFFLPEDDAAMARVAILGSTTRDDLFGTDAAGVVGQKLRINGLEFRVVGVAASKGGSGFGNADDAVYIPLTDAQRLLAGSKSLTMIDVQAEDSDAMTAVQQGISDLLMQRHNISDSTQADFSVMSQKDILAVANNMTGTFTILLASIAGISLLVGGIGIMNMMLTAVTERTREIGLRKAIGARESDISLQFLAEAVALTFLGGLIGVIIGFAVSGGVTRFTSLTTAVSPGAVGLALGVSAAIGLIFGYFPARRAAAMNPIEALRYQ